MDSVRPPSAPAKEVPKTFCQNMTTTGQKCKNQAKRICTTGDHKDKVFCGMYHTGLSKNPNDYKDFAVQEPPVFKCETDHVSLPKTGPKLGSRPSSANKGKKIKEHFKKGIDPEKSTRHLRSATASQQADERQKAVDTKRRLNEDPTPRTFPPKGDQKAFSEKVDQNAKTLHDGKTTFVPSHSETQEKEMGDSDDLPKTGTDPVPSAPEAAPAENPAPAPAAATESSSDIKMGNSDHNPNKRDVSHISPEPINQVEGMGETPPGKKTATQKEKSERLSSGKTANEQTPQDKEKRTECAPTPKKNEEKADNEMVDTGNSDPEYKIREELVNKSISELIKKLKLQNKL